MAERQVRTLRPLRRTSNVPLLARLPGSKSLTNRALVVAAQRLGETRIVNALRSDDTTVLAECLNGFQGLDLHARDAEIVVKRTRPQLGPPAEALFAGGAGTPARLLLSFAADAESDTIVTGSARLCERPMADLLSALRAIGIATDCLGAPGRLPVRVHGGPSRGGVWEIDGSVSSQFVTSLLLHASRRPEGTEPIVVALTGHLVSRPYVEMTVQVMTAAGIPVEPLGRTAWRVVPTMPSLARLEIEPDASAMSYLLAAAALTRTHVIVPGLGTASQQGDVAFLDLLEEMGCRVRKAADRVELWGAPLTGVEVDMERMPDMVLTMAVVAAAAKGRTRITNIGNLRVKECDRIAAAATELRRLGVAVAAGPDWLEIDPGDGPRVGAEIETYDDHRMAMAFAVLGLRYPGLRIADPDCVAKSFPQFWQEYDRFRAHHENHLGSEDDAVVGRAGTARIG